jgi:hypothetical protein
MILNNDEIAKDILSYCQDRNIPFFTTKYAVGKVVNTSTKEKYTKTQLKIGTKTLNEKGNIKKISAKRWQILSFDLKC